MKTKKGGASMYQFHNLTQRTSNPECNNVNNNTEYYTAINGDGGDVYTSNRTDDQVSQGHADLPQQTNINSHGFPHRQFANDKPASRSSYALLDSSAEETELSAKQRQPWLPLYSRRPVFVAFAILFGAMLISLEILFTLSRKHQGLTESSSNLRYLWTYGPTAILTLIHAFWNRVDYDAKIAAPWLRDSPGCIGRESLLVDYLDDYPPQVLHRAFKRRDWPVAASATISLLLTTLVVFSTGLFTLSQVEITDYAVPITLTSQFINNPSRLKSPSNLPAYSVEGLTHGILSYPNGFSDRFAYQTFEFVKPGIKELNVTVNGMYFGFNFTPATIDTVQLDGIYCGTPENGFLHQNQTLFVKHGDCVKGIPTNPMPINIAMGCNPNTTTVAESLVDLVPVDGLTPGHCGSANLDHKRLVFYSVKIRPRVVNETKTTYRNRSGLIEEFEVSLDRSSSIVSVLRDRIGRRLSGWHGGIHAWDVIQGLSNPFDYDKLENIPINLRITTNTTTGPNALFILDAYRGSKLNFPSLLNTTTLETLLNNYYLKYAAFRFRSLMETANITSTATALRSTDRLLVQPMACQMMASIMMLAMLMLLSSFMITPRKIPRSVEPGSILATATLVDRPTASAFPYRLGATNKRVLGSKVNGRENSGTVRCNSIRTNRSTTTNKAVRESNGLVESARNPDFTYPLVLKPISRISVYGLIIGCIVTLEITLQKSLHFQGLGDVQSDTYVHYLWTLLSATILISASALGCNDTLETVDVNMSFITPRLQLDQAHPPAPIESTSRPAPAEITIFSTTYEIGVFMTNYLYASLESIPPDSNITVFDAFFEQLVTSRYAIPLSAMSDPTQVEVVRDAIIFQHGIIAAQWYNEHLRVNVSSDTSGSVFPSLSNLAENNTGFYTGTATNPYGRNRLMQDEASTRVIQALLLITLILLYWAGS
ncbi:uncharacterized protein F4822DRAFT_432330 [Hypoxylon trugodes]|uniref:uncharacterized protein n=1 Tax=Hypoxylon trugodes TaxID=326681 RepID=UPI002193B1B9|nr:uncharacterized protein F4822DRAFT_432330 [Hypoxylon trugodes]KAI1385478.1 hypothetical protein F4822DRAFT_432330 [Hypoxylon trugodes]